MLKWLQQGVEEWVRRSLAAAAATNGTPTATNVYATQTSSNVPATPTARNVPATQTTTNVDAPMMTPPSSRPPRPPQPSYVADTVAVASKRKHEPPRLVSSTGVVVIEIPLE